MTPEIKAVLGPDMKHRLQVDAGTPLDDLIAALQQVRATCPTDKQMTVAIKSMLIANVVVITTRPQPPKW